jgi:hypothetical protein
LPLQPTAIHAPAILQIILGTANAMPDFMTLLATSIIYIVDILTNRLILKARCGTICRRRSALLLGLQVQQQIMASKLHVVKALEQRRVYVRFKVKSAAAALSTIMWILTSTRSPKILLFAA